MFHVFQVIIKTVSTQLLNCIFTIIAMILTGYVEVQFQKENSLHPFDRVVRD